MVPEPFDRLRNHLSKGSMSATLITFGTAPPIVHDSHNIICTGVSNREMYAAVKEPGVNPEIEPILTFYFMALSEIPE